MINIELASIDQIDLIMKIIKACTRHMIDNGIFQWNDKYPTKQSFIDDINNNDLFVLKLENKIIGCVCASFDMDEFYKQIVWETSSKKNIYLHRLAIHPDYQGQGFAKYVMDYIENYAKDDRSNATTGDPHAAVYISNRVDLKNPATSLIVLVAAYRDASADFRVLYQLFREDGSETELAYELFPGFDNLRDTDGDGFGCLLYTSPSPRD